MILEVGYDILVTISKTASNLFLYAVNHKHMKVHIITLDKPVNGTYSEKGNSTESLISPGIKYYFSVSF